MKKANKRRAISCRIKEADSEEMDWLNLTPAQRILETTKLWELYLALGGKLDPEPDSQSPFYFQKIQG